MTTQATDYLPFRDPAYRLDPFPYYERLRSVAPVYQHPAGFVVLTNFGDIHKALRSKGVSVAQLDFGPADPTHFTALGQDPPDHTRLRHISTGWLTPEAVSTWANVFSQMVNAALDRAARQGGFDAISDMTFPATFGTMTHLLGVSVDEAWKVRSSTYDIALSLGPGATDEDKARTTAAFEWLGDYIEDLILYKRDHPGQGMLDAFLAEEARGNMSHEEVVQTTLLFLAVGHQDISYLIAHGIRMMIEQPELLDLYRSRPETRRLVVNELLRHDAPEHLAGRMLLEPMTFSGVEVGAGTELMLILGAGNRDPEEFTNPERIDPLRPSEEMKHLSFSTGIHRCGGQMLARAEAEAVFTAIAERFQRIELAGGIEFGHTEFVRAIHKLPVHFA